MKTKNESNVYAFTCAVTKKTVKTNPKQFFATAARAGVSDEVLKTSYISREGRRIIKDAGLTAEQVVATYGVSAVYAASLKNLATPVAPESTISVEVPAEAVSTETLAATETETIDEAPVTEEVNAEAVPV